MEIEATHRRLTEAFFTVENDASRSTNSLMMPARRPLQTIQTNSPITNKNDFKTEGFLHTPNVIGVKDCNLDFNFVQNRGISRPPTNNCVEVEENVNDFDGIINQNSFKPLEENNINEKDIKNEIQLNQCKDIEAEEEQILTYEKDANDQQNLCNETDFEDQQDLSIEEETGMQVSICKEEEIVMPQNCYNGSNVTIIENECIEEDFIEDTSVESSRDSQIVQSQENVCKSFDNDLINATSLDENQDNEEEESEKSACESNSKIDEDLDIMFHKKRHRMLQKKLDETLAKHIKMYCELCGLRVANFGQLNKHMQKKHGTKGYFKCCNKKFTLRSVLMEHIQKHLNPDYYK